MKKINDDKLLFLGMEEDYYLYVVINHINNYNAEYHFYDTFDDADRYYNKINKGQYLNMYKIGYTYADILINNKNDV